MALPLQPGLVPSEVAFLCEMEMVTVIPRQRLDSLALLGVSDLQYATTLLLRSPLECLSLPAVGTDILQGPSQPLQPPHRTALPLWLALLLKRQRRANILPPPWLHPTSLEKILWQEVEVSPEAFSPPAPLPPGVSPPFAMSSTADAAADALPYHWLELGEMLLEAAPDDLVEPDSVRRLMRDLREARMAKMRAGVMVLDTGITTVKGVGAMEVGEGRAFIGGVVDGLRKIGASREQARKEREAEEREREDEGEDMDL